MHKLYGLWKNLNTDKNGNIVYGLKPNWPLYIYVVSVIISYLINNDSFVFFVLQFIRFGSLFIWAWLEIFDRVTRMRQIMGIIILIIITYNFINYLS